MLKNKPIAALITDTHLNFKNFLEVKDIFKQFTSKVKDLGIKKVYHLGDFFTERASQPMSVTNCAVDIFEMFEKENIKLYIIDGNHDKIDQSLPVSYLKPFKRFVNVIHSYKIFEKEKCRIIMLSYFTKEKYRQYLKEISNQIDSKKINVLLTHTSFIGARNNDGTKVKDGIDAKKELKKFDKIYSGHYHNRHDWYIGSSHPQNFGEDGEKGFSILYEDGNIELRNLYFKKYIKKTIDLKKISKVRIEKLRNKFSNSKNHIRFIFKGTEDQLENINYKLFNDVGIETKKKNITLNKAITSAQKGEYKEYNDQSIIALFKDYCKVNKIKENKVEKGLQYLKLK